MAEMTIVLQGDTAERLQRLIEEERYAGPEDAVAHALTALEQNRDSTLEDWLRGVVAGRSEAFANDPSRAVTPEDLRARLFDKR